MHIQVRLLLDVIEITDFTLLNSEILKWRRNYIF